VYKSFFAEKKLTYAALVLCAFIMGVSLVYIGLHYHSSRHAQSVELNAVRAYEDIMQNLFELSAPPPFIFESLNSTNDFDARSEREQLSEIEETGHELFTELLNQNSDFRGFIEIPELGILLPYVHTDNNKTYLATAFDGTRNRSGTIFLNSENDPLLLDRNNVLFGHNMRNGTMFGGLYKLKAPEYFGQTPVITLNGLTGKTQWLVFAAYVCEPDWGFIRTDWDTDGFADFLAEIQKRNIHTTNIDVDPKTDRILTLSTCSHEFEDARFVVHARRLRSGE
jgi:sortase B